MLDQWLSILRQKFYRRYTLCGNNLHIFNQVFNAFVISSSHFTAFVWFNILNYQIFFFTQIYGSMFWLTALGKKGTQSHVFIGIQQTYVVGTLRGTSSEYIQHMNVTKNI